MGEKKGVSFKEYIQLRASTQYSAEQLNAIVAARSEPWHDDKKFLIFQGGQWFVDQLWERWNQ